MAYELYNPHPNRMNLSFPAPIGEIIVQPGEVVPTPEQEEMGLSVRHLAEYKKPSWLHDTPAPIRRRLLEKARLPVPEDVVRRTRHLPEFGRASAPSIPAPRGAAGTGSSASSDGGGSAPAGALSIPGGAVGGGEPPTLTHLVPVGAAAPTGKEMSEEALRAYADRASSSYRPDKRPAKT